MTSAKIYPVIMAGGSGTRLWPISTTQTPKQFCSIKGNKSLFQDTLKRVSNPDLFEEPIIVANKNHTNIIERQLSEIDTSISEIIYEPIARDTAAAMALVASSNLIPEDAMLLIMPSDHVMQDEDAFLRAASDASKQLKNLDLIVTFGIQPSYAETDFGYMRAGTPIWNSSLRHLECFIEKPNKERAEKLLQEPNIFWNAGIFLCKRSTLRNQFAQYAPNILAIVSKSLFRGFRAGRDIYPSKAIFETVPAIAFDYAIMEKTESATLIPVDPKWSDLGSWNSVWDQSDKDDNNNALSENAFVLNSKNCLVRTERTQVAVTDLDDVVVIATEKSILVTSRDRCENLKPLVKHMGQTNSVPASDTNTKFKHDTSSKQFEWGSIEQIESGPNHKIQKYKIHPNSIIPARYHNDRTDHWTVVNGIGCVQMDLIQEEIEIGSSLTFSPGTLHGVANFGSDVLEILVTQIGSNLHEDDIALYDKQEDTTQALSVAKTCAA